MTTSEFVPTIGVDFDGVIHRYSKGWQDGSIYDGEMPGAFQALELLLTRHTVFIFTSRDTEQVVEWLRRVWNPSFHIIKDRGVKPFWNTRNVVLVTNRKLSAYAYIDDRAIEFRDWTQAIAALTMRLGQENELTPLTDETAAAAKSVASIREADDLEQAVYYAIGAASVAWDAGPHGVFQSHFARLIAEALVDKFNETLERETAPVVPPLD